MGLTVLIVDIIWWKKDKTESGNSLVQICCNSKNDAQQDDVDAKVATRSQLENNQSSWVILVCSSLTATEERGNSVYLVNCMLKPNVGILQVRGSPVHLLRSQTMSILAMILSISTITKTNKVTNLGVNLIHQRNLSIQLLHALHRIFSAYVNWDDTK